MRRVSAAVILKDDVLLLLAAVDNLGAGPELVADLVNEGHDERSNDGEDESGELLLQLLDDLGQHRDLLDCTRDGLHDVVKLNGGHHLLVDLADVASELLGVSRGDQHVLDLGRRSVGLNLVDPSFLILVPEEVLRNLVEKVAEHAGVCVLALLQSPFKLVDFVLGKLVRHWTDSPCSPAQHWATDIHRRRNEENQRRRRYP